MAVQFMVTTAGLNALVDASDGSTDPIRIAAVGLTQSAFVMAPTLTALPGEFKRITALSGAAVSETIIHMTAQDSSEDIYDLRGLGLFLTDGTLFAVYGQATPIFRKVSIAFFLMALDIAFENGAGGDIVFGDASFLFPPATETVKGVAEIATPAEAAARSDHERFITPLTLGQQLLAERGETDADLMALANGMDALVAALIARTITGGGLVTGGGDLGASRILSVLAATVADVAAGVAADRAVTPASLAGITDRTITGSGLVTGGGNLKDSRVLSVMAASAADVLAGTAADRAVTPAALYGLVRSILSNGYARIPGTELILQWGKFNAIANGSTSRLFPLVFPTECFAVVPAGGADGGIGSQDNPPVLIDTSISTSGFTVFSADDSPAGMRYLALGI